MKLEITYSMAALHEAALYIWENNSHARRWYTNPRSAIDIIDHIKSNIIRGARSNKEIILKERRLGISLSDEYISWTGTGGYYIIYSLLAEPTDDLISFEIIIVVDPAINHPDKGFVIDVVDE